MEKREQQEKKKVIKKIFSKIKAVLGFFLLSYLVLVGPVLLVNKNGKLDNDYALTALKTITYGATLLSIPEKYSYLSPGDELVVETRIREFDFDTKNDVIIDYEIKDEDENTVLKQRETVAVQTQASFLKTFNLPSSLSYGRYTVYGVLKSLDSKVLTNSTASFEISKPAVEYNQSQAASLIPSKNIFLVLSLLTIVMLILFALKNRKEEREKAPLAKKPGYKDLIEAIIKQGSFFGGVRFVKLANRIKGLKVDETGKVLSLENNGLETMINLIDLYRISIGESSIKIARKAIKNLLPLNLSLLIPKELKS